MNVDDPLAGMTEGQIVEALADPHWRLRNLYYLSDEEGNAVRFRPRPEQEKSLSDLRYRCVIPKARQRGFSTVVQIMMSDACVFVPGTAAAVSGRQVQSVAPGGFGSSGWDRPGEPERCGLHRSRCLSTPRRHAGRAPSHGVTPGRFGSSATAGA